ncbi:glycerol-3-phosphate dehydrogenase/oxidase [Alicyclobacillus tolerans]|uniref:glycerol-3-phosphate dehydrogenase/oxidase n=1 Tax=Alicyclobacillus tolerans TaxID=90970 RepID=UPI001F3F867A|nr:FAD-dependent oxidoreductase [Alicyclobacillus tolerans]MCF8564163.1 glycerol-3-phosphate dehydrogenase/oxidase [Alicyclobacillus tolerans]
MPFSLDHRQEMIAGLCSEPLDVLIIGGGVTGAGILLDAQTRGLKVGLIEMQDFAAGTSSRSTKLIHGGLRYLKQFDVELVAEVGQERAIVYENAPHVTTPLWMLLPIIKNGTYGMFMSAIGIYIYDRLAKVRDDERRKMLTKEETLQKEPLLRQDDLKGAGYYVEYRTDDARLTIEILKEAVDRGATALNYMKADSLIYSHGKVVGVHVTDLLSGDNHQIHARKIINATGPWVDKLREVDGSKRGKTMHLTKGVHIVVDHARFPLGNPVYFDVPDGRMVFAIPREGKVYVGTTDTDYHMDPTTPRATQQDIDYLVECVNYMFPSVALTAHDVESFWAGVRPLIHEEGKSPSEISRRDEVFISPSGLITIAGGKLTGYRKMADKVTSLIASQFLAETGEHYPKCKTEHIELSGGKFSGSANTSVYMASHIQDGVKLGLSQEDASKLVHRYGTNVAAVYEILDDGRDVAEKYQLPLDVYASLVYGMLHEMVVTPSDYFIRRTGAMFFNVSWVKQWEEQVVHYMAEVNSWSEEERTRHTRELELHIAEATQAI